MSSDLERPSDGAPLTRALAPLRALGCRPSEALALAVLGAGAVAGFGLLWVLAQSPAGPAPTDAPTATVEGVAAEPMEVVVHVAGAVLRPGLYRLAGGARVADALQAAGGPLPDAQLDHLNLARVVSDGEQLRVPSEDDVVPTEGGQPSGSPVAPSAWRPDGVLDLNLASAADFAQLPGIGPVLAERLVAHREQVGGFSTVGDLRSVSGIGEKKFQAIAELVDV